VPESVIARARALLSSLEASGQGRGVATAGRRKSDGQLDLFAAPAQGAAAELALETLRQVDIERTTPLDALALLAKLAASLREDS
jgi:DNA mismatch repair protein MutS